MFLSDAELTQMRADVANMLPGTCVIQSVSEVSDGAGGVTPTWAAVAGGTVACRVDPLSRRGQQETVGGAEGVVYDYIITVPYDAPIATNRRIVHGALSYEIRHLADDHSWRVSRRAFVARIE